MDYSISRDVILNKTEPVQAEIKVDKVYFTKADFDNRSAAQVSVASALDDGTKIWESKLVEPGKAIYVLRLTSLYRQERTRTVY